MLKQKKQYYKGDFHGHTTYSDGQVKPEEVEVVLDMQKMDFMAMTEHNRISEKGYPVKQMIIKAYELTMKTGHINIFSDRDDFEMNEKLFSAYRDLYQKSANNINTVLKQYGQSEIISINHMFLKPWHFQMEELDLSLVHTIEIMCDPTYPDSSKANKKAVAFLDFLWNKGIRIYGIGGSDAHNKFEQRYTKEALPSIYGDPATYVCAEDKTRKAIIEGVKYGNMYVARFLVLNISVNGEAVLPGEQCSKDQDLTYSVTLIYDSVRKEENEQVEKLFSQAVGRIIVNGQTIQEEPLYDGRNWTVKLTSKQMRSYGWIRFGIYDKDDSIIAYVNPIYYGDKKPESYQLGILLKEFDNQYDKRNII